MQKEKAKRHNSLCSVNIFSLSGNIHIKDIRKLISRLKLKAYFSLEASLVFPIILGILIFLIFILFFLNGRVHISAGAYGGAIYASSLKKDEYERFAMEYDGFNYSKKFMNGNWSGNCRINSEKDCITTEINAEMYLPIPYIFIGDNAKSFIKGRAVKDKAVELIRTTKIAERIYQAIKNEDKDNKDKQEKRDD